MGVHPVASVENTMSSSHASMALQALCVRMTKLSVAVWPGPFTGMHQLADRSLNRPCV